MKKILLYMVAVLIVAFTFFSCNPDEWPELFKAQQNDVIVVGKEGSTGKDVIEALESGNITLSGDNLTSPSSVLSANASITINGKGKADVDLDMELADGVEGIGSSIVFDKNTIDPSNLTGIKSIESIELQGKGTGRTWQVAKVIVDATADESALDTKYIISGNPAIAGSESIQAGEAITLDTPDALKKKNAKDFSIVLKKDEDGNTWTIEEGSSFTVPPGTTISDIASLEWGGGLLRAA